MSLLLPVRTARPGKTIYIGEDRCERVRRYAVEASYHSGQIVSSPQFVQFLIDNFSDNALKLITGGKVDRTD